MEKHRDDQSMPNRQSNMEKAEGSRGSESRESVRNSEQESSGAGRSVLSDEKTFEQGMDPNVVRGMSSAGRDRIRGREAQGSGEKAAGQQPERSHEREGRSREEPRRGSQ